MESSSVAARRWPIAARTRIRVRLGRFVVVGRIARVAPRAAGPPPGEWGVWELNGLPGYAMREPSGKVVYWRPIREY